jgi:hypothetical protein
MSDKDAAFASCNLENIGIWNPFELAVRGGGEVNCGLSPPDGNNDAVMDVRVSLEADQGRGSHFGADTLEPLPERWILLRQRDAIGLELAFGFSEVLVDLRFVVEVESDRAVDLGQVAQERIAFENLPGSFATIEGAHDRVERDARAGHIVAPVALFDVLAMHTNSCFKYMAKAASTRGPRPWPRAGDPLVDCSPEAVQPLVVGQFDFHARSTLPKAASVTGKWEPLDKKSRTMQTLLDRSGLSRWFLEASQ